jgi:hypothetical protein
MALKANKAYDKFTHEEVTEVKKSMVHKYGKIEAKEVKPMNSSLPADTNINGQYTSW